MTAEWAKAHTEHRCPPMRLPERVCQLRNEHGWSQGELATKITADAAQISRHERAKTSPSADAVVRLAGVFDVSCDCLLVEDAPRRRFRTPQDALGDQLAAINELADDDLSLDLAFTDALITKGRRRRPLGA